MSSPHAQAEGRHPRQPRHFGRCRHHAPCLAASRQDAKVPSALSSNPRYQINARTELAVRYNDISPLENHHCAVAFQILAQPDCNIFANVSRDSFRQIRQVRGRLRVGPGGHGAGPERRGPSPTRDPGGLALHPRLLQGQVAPGKRGAHGSRIPLTSGDKSSPISQPRK